VNLSIIIVNWNTQDLTLQCLSSLAEALVSFAPGSVEIIVVDNNSQDNSTTAISAHFPWVRLLVNSSNLGFARANNQAMTVSTGEFVLLLNSDTIVHPAAVVTLMNFMTMHPHAGAAGARLLNPDGSLQPSCSPFPTLGREAWRLFHLDALSPRAIYPMHEWSGTEPRSVDVVQGACMIVRRQALDQTGLFDNDYFMYSEEVDLCLRIKRMGWEIYWVPQAQIVHLGGQSSKQAATKMFLHLYRSKVLFFRKHEGESAACVYKGILAAAAVLRLLSSPLILIESGERRSSRLLFVNNYWALLRSLPTF
jgi:hypothetical protein